MFTGIIEETGEVAEIDDSADFSNIRIRAGDILNGARAGDSIAVNGVCLTIRTCDAGSFRAELSRETLQRTSLKNLKPRALVNLERPMRADGRFGGHLVQGHVDGLGRIHAFDRDGDSWNLRVEYPEMARKYIVEKGSIAVDGISLTVAAIVPPVFDVAIIPHTFDNTNLKHARAGDPVNLEFDVIAKYVERMLAGKTYEVRND
jgi:riboflavin synthase